MLREFFERGFTVIEGPALGDAFDQLIAQYEHAVATALPHEVRIGSTSVRVDGLLKRAPELTRILDHKPLFEIVAKVISGRPKLSCFRSRSVVPAAPAQILHQDVAPGHPGWPLVGFIFMVDAFEKNNGATRFVEKSMISEVAPKEDRIEHACGEAGSMIVFNGSIWHGHGANNTRNHRRSIQGAFVADP